MAVCSYAKLLSENLRAACDVDRRYLFWVLVMSDERKEGSSPKLSQKLLQ
jgi:hypothetical protein